MTNPLRSDQDYELFIYTLVEHFPAIRRSTVSFVRRGAGLARVAGEIYFAHALRIVVRERLLYQRYPVVMDWYGYEVWQGDEKLYWYDPQPHRMKQVCKAPIPITNTCRRISNITALLPQA